MKLNAVNDLGDFIVALEERGELSRIGAKVDPEQEISAIVNRVSKGRGGGRALLFEKTAGSQWPVAINLFGSLRRTAWALGVEDLRDLADRLRFALEKAVPGSSGERLRHLTEPFSPRIIPESSSPCREVEETRPDLLGLPALKSWPGDGGRFLTLPLVFTRHPETGAINCGMYRMQIFAPRAAGLHWRPSSGGGRHCAAWFARGEKMPVAVALGGDPALIYAAGAPLPEEIEETAFAGFLRNRPPDVTPAHGNLTVPAFSEFILEGYVSPGETKPEGPFGNHTGYYAPPAPVPVFHLSRMTRRENPVFPATLVGPPPMEDCFLAKATERIFLPMLQIDHPWLADLNFPLEGIFHGCALVSQREGTSKNTQDLLQELLGSPLLKSSRLLVLFDHDVDIGNYSESFWRAINHVEPLRDVLVEKGRLSIDATRKVPWSKITEDPVMGRRVEERWKDYGLED